ncbi:CRTAC1 family protein [Puniceicoccaceae bacterium K14]|nr:CRTAC1 family protein [Puniceicoccaceae bacterium K14]
MNIFSKGLLILASIAAIAVIAVVVVVIKIQGFGPETGSTELEFVEVSLPFTLESDLDNSLPFTGIATLDFDGDKIDELVIGGGKNQADAFFKYTESGFQALEIEGLEKEPNDTTFGIASIDTTGDGLDELFIARESGVYYAINTGDGYHQELLDFGIADNTTPLSIALGDINQDGFVDLYISGYIKLDLIEGETNFSDTYGGYSHLLLNDGQNHWTDISKEAGIWRQHNTFLATFVDLNQDQWPDIVVAQDTGKVEIWENLKNNTFKRHADPTDYAYPMGIGVGDIDNDGDADLYFSNVGTTLPRALLVGNLTDDQPFNMDYILLRNDGDFQFTDISIETNAAEYGFGWGTTIADFNSDSHMDLYFSQNYARFPGVDYLKLYPGRLLEQQEDGTFLSVEEDAGSSNEDFGITQVVSDFNQDGRLDLVIANLNGPARAFITDTTGGNAGLTVRLPSGTEWLNTIGEVTLKDGSSIKRQFVACEGLSSDGFHGLHFGLGKQSDPVDLSLVRPDGIRLSISDLEPNQSFIVTHN